MDYQRIPKPGEIYKHFKNKLYQIITVATHTETEDQLVVYQALYGDYKIFARPLNMFLSEVDHNKYPEVSQKYRFELNGYNYTVNETTEYSFNKEVVNKEIENEEKLNDNKESFTNNLVNITEEHLVNSGVNNQKEAYSKNNIENKSEYDSTNNLLQEELVNESGVNSILLEFLDAKSYNEKLAVIISKKKYIDDRLLNDMAVSIDFTIEEGNLEERIKGLIFALETLARFENKRLR